MTAVALAEYLILKSDPQSTVLHDSRYSQTNIRAAYATARHGFRAYNTNPLRPIETLNRVKAALLKKSEDRDVKPRAQAAALREIELIDLFILRENALGLRHMPLIKAPRFEPLSVQGVSLSVQPDFLVSPPDGRIGAAILRVTKAPDPDACRLESTKRERGDHRREMARYLVAMLEMTLRVHPEYAAKLDRDLLFVSDVRIGERIGAGSDHSARLKDIDAACAQVAAIWPNVKPRPSIYKKPDE